MERVINKAAQKRTAATDQQQQQSQIPAGPNQPDSEEIITRKFVLLCSSYIAVPVRTHAAQSKVDVLDHFCNHKTVSSIFSDDYSQINYAF